MVLNSLAQEPGRTSSKAPVFSPDSGSGCTGVVGQETAGWHMSSGFWGYGLQLVESLQLSPNLACSHSHAGEGAAVLSSGGGGGGGEVLPRRAHIRGVRGEGKKHVGQ